MLLITIPENEIYDEEKNEFLLIKKQTIKLEHSLLSISKWESKWHKPYLTTTKKTEEESVDYVRCMTITQNIDDMVYMGLTPSLMEIINEYIENPMTATTIRKKTGGAPSREILTNEVIYSKMTKLGIPFTCEKWHLNRLLMLINVCALSEQPPEKMSRSELASRNRALNAARRKRLNSKG